MKFRVRGADRDTGEDVELIIDCASPAEAESSALRRGLLIHRIDPVTSSAPPTAPPPDRRPPPDRTEHPQLIEQTSKRWKRPMLICMLIALAGIPVVCFSCFFGGFLALGTGSAGVGGLSLLGFLLGMAMVMGGLATLIVFRLLAWWHHG